ncbi:MAG: alpha-L-rhamnosidase C-terminal domain-containing protein, partial [Actinomycetales bacterium]
LAWLREFVTPGGRVMSDAQTAYALALAFDIATDPDLRTTLGARLATLARKAGYRIGTGFVGTPIVADALTATGHLREAGRMLTQTECPSWLYPVTMGATTIWERWDSMLPDGTINPGEMTSFNHYALGAVADWIYQVVAGIRPAAPGYRELLLAPTPGPGLDWARAALETPHGRVECGWQREPEGYLIEVLVPDGVAAELRLPDGSRRSIQSGQHSVRSAAEKPMPR